MLTEHAIIRFIEAGRLTLPPLSIEWTGSNSLEPPKDTTAPDVTLRVRWRNKVLNFGAEINARNTRQAVEQAMAASRHLKQNAGAYPMVVVPYLNESSLHRLEEQAVSGIDLCGNGIIVVPGELLLLRTGYPNKFPSSEPIKKIYNGISSLVARVFLSRPEYPAVGEIQEEIRKRGSRVALSTVSKVLSSLEADLMVGRSSGTIRLLQPEKLIENLAREYQPFAVTRRFQARYLTDAVAVMEALVTNAGANHERHVLTGAGSANLYATLTPPDKLSLYCTNIDGLLSLRDGENPLPLEETSRFPDVELFETQEEAAYFDTHNSLYHTSAPGAENLYKVKTLHHEWLPLYCAATPLQTYLELMTSGPREKQTAEQVKQYILASIKQRQP